MGYQSPDIITLVPGWSDLGALFGLGQILWFICVDITLIYQTTVHTADIPSRSAMG